MAPKPIRAAPINDRDIGSAIAGAIVVLAWKPRSEPAPSVTVRTSLREYWPLRNWTLAYRSSWNELACTSGWPGPAILVAPMQLVMLVLLVLKQLVNVTRLASLSTVMDPPIWLSIRNNGGATGPVKPVSLNTNLIVAVASEVFLMSRVEDRSSATLGVPGEL